MDEYQIIKNFVTLLEQASYPEIEKYLAELEVKYPKTRLVIDYQLYEVGVLSEIARRKIALGDLFLENSGTTYFVEDRTRMVFLLAKFAHSNFKAFRQACIKEFGEYFQAFEFYNVNSRKLSWKELALRAKTIRNAYINFDLLNTRDIADEILDFYKIFEVSKEEELKRLVALADQVLPLTTKEDLAIPSLPSFRALLPKIQEFYKLCGRLNIDIETISQSASFEKINEFLFLVKYCALAKLYLMRNKLPLDKPEMAKEALLRLFAQRFSLTYMADDIVRQQVALKPLKPNV